MERKKEKKEETSISRVNNLKEEKETDNHRKWKENL